MRQIEKRAFQAYREQFLEEPVLVASSLTRPYYPFTGEPLVADARGTYCAGKLVRDSAGALYFIAWRQ